MNEPVFLAENSVLVNRKINVQIVIFYLAILYPDKVLIT